GVVVELKRSPRNSEQLVTHSQESAEGEGRVTNMAAVAHVEHQVLDVAQVLVCRVAHRHATYLADARRIAFRLLVDLRLVAYHPVVGVAIGGRYRAQKQP